MNSNFRWTCRDERYLIRRNGSTDIPTDNITGICNWYNVFDTVPANLECVVKYCNNATDSPIQTFNYEKAMILNSSTTYNFNLRERVQIGSKLAYFCNQNFYLLLDTNFNSQAGSNISIPCQSNGTFQYPEPWPVCADTITCSDPGSTPELDRNEI